MNSLSAPKYMIIKQNIIQKINNDSFRSGELIPSERELVEMFNMSRITVRKALSELENEGYLYKVQGKGTFVKGEQNRQNLFSLTSCTQDIIRLGMTPSRKVVFSAVILPDEKRRQTLELNEGEEVFSLKRIYYADNEPINYTETYLPYRYINGIQNFDFSQTSLYEVMENKYNISISHSVRTVEAVIAHDKICEMLCIKEGVPLLLFRSVTYGKVKDKAVPVETFKCYYRSDHFSFFINQIRNP